MLLSWSVLLASTPLFLLGCKSLDPAVKDPKPPLQEPAPEKQDRFPASMLTSLEVSVDSCPVFLEPKKNSPTFGPLTRGEVVKWLDGREVWTRVWISRLLISGWVGESSVREITDTNPDQPPIPEKELTPMMVVSEKINVRDGPSTKSEVVLVAGKDDVFYLLGVTEGWCRVWVPGQNRAAWIFRKGLVRKTEK